MELALNHCSRSALLQLPWDATELGSREQAGSESAGLGRSLYGCLRGFLPSISSPSNLPAPTTPRQRSLLDMVQMGLVCLCAFTS